LFSNVSSFGPLVTPEITVNPNFKRAMHLRRNTKLNIYNSVFAGYLTGLFIDGAASQANATAGDLKIRNTYLAGCNDFFSDAFDSTFFSTEGFANLKLASNSELEIADPFNLDDPDFMPTENSPVLTASIWYEEPVTSVSDNISEKAFNVEVFPNPFSGSARIGLTIKSSSHVCIRLYDVTGALVQTLADESRVTGNHVFTINVAQKGIYFADMLINETRQVLKLVAR
jgi:hypothetical protein